MKPITFKRFNQQQDIAALSAMKQDGKDPERYARKLALFLGNGPMDKNGFGFDWDVEVIARHSSVEIPDMPQPDFACLVLDEEAIEQESPATLMRLALWNGDVATVTMPCFSQADLDRLHAIEKQFHDRHQAEAKPAAPLRRMLQSAYKFLMS